MLQSEAIQAIQAEVAAQLLERLRLATGRRRSQEPAAHHLHSLQVASSNAAAMFDITVTMVEIIKVGRSLISSPRFIMSSIFLFELIFVVELI